MKLFGKNYFIAIIITFVILFAMNYIGSQYDDKLERALMTAGAGVVGLSIGLFVMNKFKDGDAGPDFD